MHDNLMSPVMWALVAVYALLVFASLLVGFLRRRGQGDHTELGQRIRSWWIMVGVFSVAILVNRTVSIVFLALVAFLAFKEYLAMVTTRRADRRVVFWAFLAIPVQFYWVAIGWYGMFIVFIPVFMFLLLPARMVLIGDTKGFLKAVGTLHWGLMTTVFSISHAAYLLVLPAAVNPHAGGAGLLFFLIFLTQFNDVAQFTWGKLFGRTKIAPNLSPSKTVEGFVGGALSATALGAALSWLTPFGVAGAAALSFVIVLMGFFGGLVMSAIKRDRGVKDWGHMIAGHGGFIDRLDSVVFSAPVFFHLVRFFWSA